MATPILDVLDYLPTLQEQVSGVRHAYDARSIPLSIERWPSFMSIFGGDVPVEVRGSQGRYELRYNVDMYLMIARGGDVRAGYSALIEYIWPVLQLFAVNGRLGGRCQMARITRIERGEYAVAGIEFVGVRFVLTVDEHVIQSFSGGA